MLAKLEKGYSIAAACRAAKVDRKTYYNWRTADPEGFGARADDAIEAGTDMLEDSSRRQAIEGNTALMVLLLKGRRPERYADRVRQEVSGKDGAPLTINVVEVASPITPDDAS